ncbi:MAG TPA: hypothetical protein VLF14_02820, partial [Candidatus Binatia bacterium]|nr:hypothetical protein [Candidatus Binatia bacterium]
GRMRIPFDRAQPGAIRDARSVAYVAGDGIATNGSDPSRRLLGGDFSARVRMLVCWMKVPGDGGPL